ncbi:MAG: T9SS type A sorting domain-containing protein [Saprospiraceae bacterium]
MNKSLLTNLLVLFVILINPFIFFAQNSTCATAMVIVEGSYEVDSFLDDGAVFQGATAAVWYRFEPITDGVFTVSSCEGGGDTRLVIMFLDDCANVDNLQIINSAEDNCADGKGGTTASSLAVAAKAGFSYVIYWDNGQSNDSFTWNLTFESVGNSSEGATCASAIPIDIGTHQVDSLTGIGAIFSDAVSAKWYQFTPTVTNVLAINACESGVDTRLFVFESGCETSQIIGQDDNSCGVNGGSILETEVIVDSGQVYYIYWDDHGAKNGFDFQLGLEELPSAIAEPSWAEQINIYPNPATDFLFVAYDFVEAKNIEMTIYNGIGQLINKEEWASFQKGKMSIFLDDFPTGLYFLNLNANGTQMTRQFVVQK